MKPFDTILQQETNSHGLHGHWRNRGLVEPHATGNRNINTFCGRYFYAGAAPGISNAPCLKCSIAVHIYVMDFDWHILGVLAIRPIKNVNTEPHCHTSPFGCTSLALT
jgi:hypothetical protein